MLETLTALFEHVRQWLDPETIAAGGHVVITLVIFLETGVVLGVVLPGESLLLLAGMLAGSGHLSLAILMPALLAAAVAGDTTGYALGASLGPRLFTRKSSFWFRPAHLHRAHGFYKRNGGKTIVLARFVPIVRTFAPIVAGAARMHYGRFMFFNVLGASIWVPGVLLLGYFLGRAIPNLAHKAGFAVALVIVLAVVVPAAEYARYRLIRRRLPPPCDAASPQAVETPQRPVTPEAATASSPPPAPPFA